MFMEGYRNVVLVKPVVNVIGVLVSGVDGCAGMESLCLDRAVI